MDTNGFPLLAEVTTANVHDSKGTSILLKDLRIYYSSVSLVKADKGYCCVDSGLDGCIVECVISCRDTFHAPVLLTDDYIMSQIFI